MRATSPGNKFAARLTALSATNTETRQRLTFCTGVLQTDSLSHTHFIFQ